jgi:hypothetical protein
MQPFARHIPFEALRQSIMSLIAAVRSHEDVNARYPCIGLGATATLNEALRVLIATKIHRLYLTAEGDKGHVPHGVVSLTDIIRIVLREHQ